MSETDPTRSEPGATGRGKGSSADGNEPIPLEPSEPAPARRPAPKARIDSPGLLEDFDEDADLESDPEVERIVKGVPVGQPERPVPASPDAAAGLTGEPLCASEAWRVPAAIGGAATITAAVLAGIYAESVEWAHVLNTLYLAAVHTATGVGAVVAAALLLGRRVGSFESAAARIFMAVAIFLAVYSLEIPISGKIDEIVLGAAAYFGMVVVGFRLPPRDAAVIGGAHFALALLLTVGNQLAGVISRAGSVQ